MNAQRELASSAAPPSALERDDEESYLHEEIELDLADDPGSDDAEASELDIGAELEDLLSEGSGDNEPIELDLGTMVELGENEGALGDQPDSELAVDPALGLDLPDALLPDDGAEGIDDRAIVVDESKFPELVSDDGSEGIAAEREITLGAVGDEARLPLAAVQYRAEKPKTALEACSALTARGTSVVLASSDLLWFRAEETTPLRLAIDGTALADVVLLGPQADVVIAATRAGQLFRRARFASQAEQLQRLRERERPLSGTRAELAFGAAHAENSGDPYVATQDGALYRILDAGERFERVELAGKVVALARESATVLVARERELSLVFVQAEREPIALTGSALAVARAEAPALATAQACIALSEPARALVVSHDGGRSFRGVPGTANTTALAGVNEPSGPRFYAAVYRETSDQTELCVIDPERAEAEIVARIEGGEEVDAQDPVDRAEWARVSRLVWHAESGTLWAVGGFGVLRFVRASS